MVGSLDLVRKLFASEHELVEGARGRPMRRRPMRHLFHSAAQTRHRSGFSSGCQPAACHALLVCCAVLCALHAVVLLQATCKTNTGLAGDWPKSTYLLLGTDSVSGTKGEAHMRLRKVCASALHAEESAPACQLLTAAPSRQSCHACEPLLTGGPGRRSSTRPSRPRPWRCLYRRSWTSRSAAARPGCSRAA